MKLQKGTITKGGGLNWQERAEAAKKKGFEVREFEDHIELWIDPSKKGKKDK